MSKDYISIQEASELANKSIQTIRRTIKSKKIIVRRQKTPQGFNYLIEKESFSSFYKLGLSSQKAEPIETTEIPAKENIASGAKQKTEKKMAIEPDDFKNFVKTLENLLSQHGEERQNFLRLINTLQEKVFVLENQLNLLKGPIEKKWYQLWK